MTDTIPKLDKPWAKQLKRPLAKWHHNQGSTNDCGPFSAAIVANGLRDKQVIDAPALARAMEQAPKDCPIPLPFSLDRIPGSATFPWGVAHALEQQGFKARWHVLSSIDHLKENLDKGLATIVIVGNPKEGWAHYKVLYAWDPKHGWAFVDPAAAEKQAFSYQEDASFEEQWSAIGRICVEVWDE